MKHIKILKGNIKILFYDLIDFLQSMIEDPSFKLSNIGYSYIVDNSGKLVIEYCVDELEKEGNISEDII